MGCLLEEEGKERERERSMASKIASNIASAGRFGTDSCHGQTCVRCCGAVLERAHCNSNFQIMWNDKRSSAAESARGTSHAVATPDARVMTMDFHLVTVHVPPALGGRAGQ